MQSKAKIVVIILVVALVAVVAASVYRSQVAPGLVVEKILKYWRPGYHNMVDNDWSAQADYEPLYRVLKYHVLKIDSKKDTANVLARINYETPRREPKEEIYTFVLEKTRGGWKAREYYKGFASVKRAVTSLQDILGQPPAADLKQ